MPSNNIFHWAFSNILQWSNLRALFTGSMAGRERQEVKTLYAQVLRAYNASPYSKEDAGIDFVEHVVDEAFKRAGCVPLLNLRTEFCEVVWQLALIEPVIVGMPDTPDIDHMSYDSLHQLRALLTVKQRVLNDPDYYVDLWQEKIIRLLQGILNYFPPFVFDTQLSENSGTFTVPLIDVCTNPPDAIERTMATMYDDDVVQAGLFALVRQRFEDNLARASGLTTQEAARSTRTVRTPSTSPALNSRELVAAFLSGTPFLALFLSAVPFPIPDSARFAHQWILAPQGAGKTQAIQFQVLRDLQTVADDKASIIVMDSQGDLIRNIAGLKCFAEGQPLYNKLLLIEPDPEYPLALNIFDMGKDRLDHYSIRDRERLTNSTLELLTYVIGGLSETEMTPKQQTLFRYVLRACMQIPDATIHTFAELLSGTTKYQTYIDQLEGPAKLFFETQFNDVQFKQTKQEVAWRLMYLLENPTFERMFSNPRSKLDLYTELQSCKVILINTDKDLLKDKRTEMFGRFFIAMLLQSAQERAALQRDDRTPVFCYIDECHDYIANDTHITTLLDQARKMNIGLILANQRCAQISPSVLDALCNVSIKMVRALSDSDAHTLARNMQSTPEFLATQPEQTFATSVRGNTKHALSLHIPFFELERLPRMDRKEQILLRMNMRKKYCVAVAPRRIEASPDLDPSPSPGKVKNGPSQPTGSGDSGLNEWG